MDEKYLEAGRVISELLTEKVAVVMVIKDEASGKPVMRAIKPFGIKYHVTDIVGEIELASPRSKA